MTKITFYNGIHEIGGNQFLVEDRGTKVWLDFGMPLGRVKSYYADFMEPRTMNGMNDLFEFKLLPVLKGLYRRDYAKHSGFDGNEETEYHAAIITHAHVDHGAYIHYFRPEIPIYCTEATKLILQSIQEMGGDEDYLIFKEQFRIYRNRNGEMSRARGEDRESSRKFNVIQEDKPFNIDSITVEPMAVDHSLPGVVGLIVHTSSGTIAYTADLRYHGRRSLDTERFVAQCAKSDVKFFLCEGTHINDPQEKTKNEFQVEEDVKAISAETKGLIVCGFPPRDLDRLLSFYNAAKSSNRDLVIDPKQAYVLKLFQTSDQWKYLFPSPTDKGIRIYIPRNSWGLIGKDLSYWTKKQLLEDYSQKPWLKEFVEYSNAVNFLDVEKKQSEYIFYCGDYQLQQLIDVRPKEGSVYIRSMTEPYDKDSIAQEERVKCWVKDFHLVSREEDWARIHASGHGYQEEIRMIIEGSHSHCLVPVHTENEEVHKRMHPNVKQVARGDSITF